MDGFITLVRKQALHFFYGLGAFLAPMIIEPFLLNVDCTLWIDPAAGAASSRPSVTVSDPITSLEMAHKKSRVQYAFLIMALVQVARTRSIGRKVIIQHAFSISRRDRCPY